MMYRERIHGMSEPAIYRQGGSGRKGHCSVVLLCPYAKSLVVDANRLSFARALRQPAMACSAFLRAKLLQKPTGRSSFLPSICDPVTRTVGVSILIYWKQTG